MTILILQSVLLLFVAFLIGCLIGCLLRQAMAAPSDDRLLRRAAEIAAASAAAGTAAQRPAATARPKAMKPDDAAAPSRTPEPAAEPAADQAAEPRPAPVPTGDAPSRQSVWSAVRSADAVILSGPVATLGDRDGVLAAARRLFPDGAITDAMAAGRTQADAAAARLATDEMAPNAPQAEHALTALSRMETGRVTIDHGRLSLSGGAATAEAAKALARDLRGGDLPPGLAPGLFDIVSNDQPAPQPVPDAEPEAPKAEKARGSADAPADLPGARPTGLGAPRAGTADDLKRIKGIGAVNEAKLNGLGVWHFDQIAAWTDAEIQWVDGYLAFKGRIAREDWIGQARKLADTDG